MIKVGAQLQNQQFIDNRGLLMSLLTNSDQAIKRAGHVLMSVKDRCFDLLKAHFATAIVSTQNPLSV